MKTKNSKIEENSWIRTISRFANGTGGWAIGTWTGNLNPVSWFLSRDFAFSYYPYGTRSVWYHAISGFANSTEGWAIGTWTGNLNPVSWFLSRYLAFSIIHTVPGSVWYHGNYCIKEQEKSGLSYKEIMLAWLTLNEEPWTDLRYWEGIFILLGIFLLSGRMLLRPIF